MTSLASMLAATLPSQQQSAPAASGAAGATAGNGVLPKDAIPKNMAHAVDIDAEIPLEEVCLSSLAMSKIIKHGKEGREGREGSHGGAGGMGVLVGLDLEGVLEVADSFALPGRASSSNRDSAAGTAEEDTAKGNAQFQRKMLAALKDVKGAHSVVGYYHTVSFGQFYKQSVVESLASGADKTRHGGVIVIHDVTATARGVAAFKAFKLSQAYLNARKGSTAKFSTQSLTDNQLTFTEMFDELPVKVRSSPLAAAFLKLNQNQTQNPAILSLPSSSSHTRALESLIDSLDALRSEENNAAYNLRQIARERGRMDQYIAKKREENATRVAQGLAPLPEEDYARLFKVPVEPSRMEGMMLLGQVDSVARELEALAGVEMVKMYAAKAGGA
ncbi:hypothetical protein FRB94_001426 [Tulasnella sp. JGI-2019a]|nr:hypothetical protein FRB94_001426 [Tulasnella sp. JGI-2019a]